jgi:hypothetical protein
MVYRLDVPRTSFFTLRFIEPRAAVRFAFGAAFLRDALRDFLRSSLLKLLVFAICVSFFYRIASSDDKTSRDSTGSDPDSVTWLPFPGHGAGLEHWIFVRLPT